MWGRVTKGTPKKGGISYWGFFVCFYQLASLRVKSHRNSEVNSISAGSASPFRVLSEARGKYAGLGDPHPWLHDPNIPFRSSCNLSEIWEESSLVFFLSMLSLSPPPFFLSSLSPHFPRFIQGPGLMFRQRHHLRLSCGPLQPEPLPVIPGRRQRTVESGRGAVVR